MTQLKMTAFSGSLRTASWNKKLLLHGCDYLREKGCIINYIDLRSLEMPLFDEDLEDKIGMHPGAQKLLEAVNDSDALFIGNPEYNGGTTGALKNAIDWLSRAEKNPLIEKPVLLVGSSSGHWGGIRSNMATRLVLTHLGAFVMPTQVTIPFNDKSITLEGSLVDHMHQKQLQLGCNQLIRFTKAWKSAAL
jgi:chromate reductase, NAD(P)H dehydrogenase (quinone)